MNRSPSNPRHLRLVKSLFDEAARFARIGDAQSAMKSVLLLHVAVEQALNLVILQVNPTFEAGEDIRWKTLWTEANKGLSASDPKHTTLPGYAQIDKLRRTRNLVQHAGSLPNELEVAGMVPHIEDFLRAVFDRVWGLNFTQYTPVDAIRNEGLRRAVLEAAQAQEVEEPVLAVAAVRIAYESVVKEIRTVTHDDRWTEKLKGRYLPAHSRINLGPASVTIASAAIHREAEPLVRVMIEQVSVLRDEIVLTSMGLSMADAHRFLTEIRRVGASDAFGGAWSVVQLGEVERDVMLAAAGFSIAFFTDFLLLAQDAFPGAVECVKVGKTLFEQEVWKSRNERKV